MRLHYKILLICYFILISITLNYAQDVESRIYYYDFDESAFVSETVHGEDKTILVEYELPDGHETIIGDGFSPSGSWFVWTSGQFGIADDNYLSLHLFNTQTSEHFAWSPDDDQQIQFMKWSPVDDLLIIVFSNTRDIYSEFFVLYDLRNNTFSEINSVAPNFQMGHASWSSNGRYVSLIYREFTIVFDVINLSKEIIETPATNSYGCEFSSIPNWIDEQTLSYLSIEETSVQTLNLESGEILSFAPLSGIIRAIDWSHDRNNGLVYVEVGEENYSLWLLDLLSTEMILIDDDIIFYDNCTSPLNKTSWNENSRFAYYIDRNLQPHVVSIDTSILMIPNLDERQLSVGTNLLWIDTNLVFSTYNVDSNNLDIFQYDLSNETLLDLTSNLDRVSAGISPISVSSNYIIFDNHIFDTYSSNWYPVVSDFEGVTPTLVNGRESPNHNWAFLEGRDSRFTNPIFISNLQSGNARVITACAPAMPSCYGWLYGQR
ncbi:MAG: hypothetical protein RLP44_29110 [Aggregatilineales bacterium]